MNDHLPRTAMTYTQVVVHLWRQFAGLEN